MTERKMVTLYMVYSRFFEGPELLRGQYMESPRSFSMKKGSNYLPMPGRILKSEIESLACLARRSPLEAWEAFREETLERKSNLLSNLKKVERRLEIVDAEVRKAKLDAR